MEENKTALLRNKGIAESDIENITDYDEQTGEVIFKNGDKRTVTEVIERCMGYFRPIDQWNIGKREEHKERKYFSIEKSLDENRVVY